MLRCLSNLTSNGAGILGTPYVGVLAADIPSTGDSGASLLYNDIDAGDPTGCYYRVEILTQPNAGSLQVDENGAFSFTGAVDGTYTGTERVYKYSPSVGLLSANDTTYAFSIGATQTMQAILASSASATATLTTSTLPAQLQASLKVVCTLTSALSSQTPLYLATSVQASSSVSATLTTTSSILLYASLTARGSALGTLTNQQAIPMFTPSTARTVAVQSSSPLFVAGKFWNLTDPKKPRGVKDPNATIDITFDWDDWLTDVGSPLISEITFTIGGADSQGSYLNDSKATVFVSGGTVGTVVTIACKIKTATTPARIDERTVYLSIEDQ